MSLSIAEMAVLGSAVVLGLRHGVDYDHIAAITDITTIQDRPRRGLFLSGMYALGHGAVVLLLGALAVAIGVEVPERLDAFMGRAVGVTLVLLGVLVLWSLIRTRGAQARPISRGMLAVRAFHWLTGLLHRRGHHHPHTYDNRSLASGYGPLSALGVGIIHGIGAETPSQLVLFVLAANFTSAAFGVLAVAVFVGGLLVTNTAMSLVLAFSSGTAVRRPWVYRSLLGASAAYSLVMGVIFAGGLSGRLPGLL